MDLFNRKIAGSHEGRTTRLRFREIPKAIANESRGDRGDTKAASATTANGPKSRRERVGHTGYANTLGICDRRRVQSTDLGGDCHSSGLHLHRGHIVLHVGGLGFLRELLLRLHLYEHYRLWRLRAKGDYLRTQSFHSNSYSLRDAKNLHKFV